MGWAVYGRIFLITLFLSFSFLSFGNEIKSLKMINGLKRHVLNEEFKGKVSQETHLHKRYFYLNFEMTSELRKYIKKLSSLINLKYINRNYRRSDIFRDYLFKKLQKKKMPLELFYVPMAETNFNPFAVSRSNAVGMWQFSSKSAGPWLKLNENVDERMDFVLATDAALEKLKYNYEELGDWLLALAAYNAGLYKIKKLIKDNNGIKDFWFYYDNSLIPIETKDYILKILSYSYIAGYIGRYGFELDWDTNKEWTALTLDKTIDIQKLETEAKIENNALTLANAKYKNGVTPHKKESDLKFLVKDQEAIVKVLKNDYEKIKGFYNYKIKKKDTFYSIAKENQISMIYLQKYNENVDPKRMKIGSFLRIPVNKKNIIYKAKSNLVAPLVQINIKQVNDSIAKKENENLYGFLNTKNSIKYKIKKNDTLSLISKKYGVTEEFLMFWNEKKNKKILEGEIIKIPK